MNHITINSTIIIFIIYNDLAVLLSVEICKGMNAGNYVTMCDVDWKNN